MTLTQTKYGLRREVALPYPQAVERVREELGTEGFGVLTEIDIKATLKQKIDVDFRPYVILGACDPTLAHQRRLQLSRAFRLWGVTGGLPLQSNLS